MTETVYVKAEYREKLRVKHLAMEPSLQGKTVSFRLDNQSIKIRLPAFSPGAKWSEDLEAEADTWETKTGNILSVYIYAVHIVIENLTFAIPTTAAQHGSVNMSLFSPAEREILDKQSDDLYLVARRALDRWIGIVRWKTGMALVEVDNRPINASLDGGRLFNLDHGGKFYSPRIPRIVKALRRTTLTPQTWQAITDALANDEIPPIWNEYFASSQRRIEAIDLRAGVIDLAIAAEATIKQYSPVSKTKRDKKVSEILDKWDQFGFPPAGPWLSDLKTLNQVRNYIMHRGDEKQVDPALCKRSLAAVKNLIGLLT
jgi:hypothetical protein